MCKSVRAPAVSASDVIKPRLLVVRVWTAADEAVVSLVIEVLVQRHHIHVLQANVDAYSRLAVPEEVRLLFDVSDVVGGLQLTGVVKVLQEQVRRRVHTESYDASTTTLPDVTTDSKDACQSNIT